MDAGAFVQENKRWLLGCGIGFVVFLIASSIVDSVYAATGPEAKKLGGKSEVYDQAARDAARQENERLTEEEARLRKALAFVPSEKYLPANKGSLDEYLVTVGKELKQAIARAANQREVQVNDGAVTWTMPNNVDDRRNTLFGLELIDEAQKRLFAAHDTVRKVDDDAMALRAILSLKLDERRGQRNTARSTKAGDIDIRDFLSQEQVTLQFQSDEATAVAFQESCRQPDRTLVVDSWQMLKGPRSGEPCTVKCTLLGIAFKESK